MNIPPIHNDRAPTNFALPSYDHTATWYSGQRLDSDSTSPPDATVFSPPMFPGFELEGQRDLYFGEAGTGPTHASGTYAGDASILSGAGAMQLAPTRESPFYGQTDHPDYTANASYVDEADAANGTQDLDEFLALLASADQSMVNNVPSSKMTPETSTRVGQYIASHAQSYQPPTEEMPAGNPHAYAASSIPSFNPPVSIVGPSVEDTMPFSAYLQNYQRPVYPALPNSYRGTWDDQLNLPAYCGTALPPILVGAGGASQPLAVRASNHPGVIQGPFGGWRERATVPAANFDATSLASAPFSITSTAPLGNHEMNEGQQALGPQATASTRQSVGVQRTRRTRPAQSSAPYPIPVRNDGCDAQVGDPGPSTVARASPSYGEFSSACRLDQYCAQCWDAGKKVVWMDDERRKKHDLREHSKQGHPPRGVNPKHKRQ
ncbi:hypothetical protein EXIGLDRAFT_747428 [Exidia glandulosa HHB12029]|uniref:Uncharacterized protein n=1 Tax=Exidia glandulosa HHB12029 TaxID=1314781 RepID=A0A165KUF5_EXIGL|nr:hypothetical protein EXIGLDRAFT_747428 [Exidia glandulosa HHB12029]